MIQSAIDFDPPQARKGDPATSHAAGEKSAQFAAAHESIIYGLLHDAGDHGLTCQEMAERCRLDSVQIARRMKAMLDRGLIRRQPHLVLIDRVVYEQRDGFQVWRIQE